MQQELFDDCPTHIDSSKMSYGEFMLMKYPDETYSVWFRENGHIGVHSGKRRFKDEPTARMFLCNCIISGFSVADL